MSAKKFVKVNDIIEIQNPTKDELLSIFKIKIDCKLVFKNEGQIIDYIILGERTNQGNTNLIEISTEEYPQKTIGYDKLIEFVREKIKDGILYVQIDFDKFIAKESLLTLIGNINPIIITSCIYIDYTDNKFIIMNNPLPNGAKDALYYYELNDSVLIFSSNGPRVIYNKFSSVEEVFCSK